MKALEEIKVSVYENVYSKKPKVMSFLEVIIMCIHPVYASIVNAIRRYYAEGDHAAAQKLKEPSSPVSLRQGTLTEHMPSKTSSSPAILSGSITIM